MRAWRIFACSTEVENIEDSVRIGVDRTGYIKDLIEAGCDSAKFFQVYD